MSIKGWLKSKFSKEVPDEEDDEGSISAACPHCHAKQLMRVPTEDDFRMALLCGNCGWHSDD